MTNPLSLKKTQACAAGAPVKVGSWTIETHANGHTIATDPSGEFVDVWPDGELTLCDCSSGTVVTATAPLDVVLETLRMAGWTVSR